MLHLQLAAFADDKNVSTSNWDVGLRIFVRLPLICIPMLIFRRFSFSISVKNSTHEMHIGIFCNNKTSHFVSLLSLLCHDSESHTDFVTNSFVIEQGQKYILIHNRGQGTMKKKKKNALHTEVTKNSTTNHKIIAYSK
jgi:hypothetical protein